MSKKTRILAVASLLVVSSLTAPVSRSQVSFDFKGTWYLTLNFGPGAPTFNYGVVAEASPGFLDLAIQPNDNFGGGLVIGPCQFGPLGRASGMTWRGTPLTGADATGVSLTFEVPSGRTPSTIVLRGDFMTPNRIEGTAIIIGDNTNASASDFDPNVGYDVNLGTFVLERADSPCVAP